MSCYASGYLRNGSWLDAQRICDNKGSHLWTINSHEEWYDVYTKQWENMPNSIEGQSQTPVGAIFYPYFFIGLIYPTQDNDTKVSIVVSSLVIHFCPYKTTCITTLDITVHR